MWFCCNDSIGRSNSLGERSVAWPNLPGLQVQWKVQLFTFHRLTLHIFRTNWNWSLPTVWDKWVHDRADPPSPPSGWAVELLLKPLREDDLRTSSGPQGKTCQPAELMRSTMRASCCPGAPPKPSLILMNIPLPAEFPQVKSMFVLPTLVYNQTLKYAQEGVTWPTKYLKNTQELG